jgi:hypothetical protein
MQPLPCERNSEKVLLDLLSFSLTTATTNLAKHIKYEHQDQTTKSQQQLAINFLTAKQEKIIDNSIAKYIVQGRLSHLHVESAALQDLMDVLRPGYQTKSARTVKRRLLVLYLYLKTKLSEYFASLKSKLSITFDGWSNPMMKGKYCVIIQVFIV